MKWVRKNLFSERKKKSVMWKKYGIGFVFGFVFLCSSCLLGLSTNFDNQTEYDIYITKLNLKAAKDRDLNHSEGRLPAESQDYWNHGAKLIQGFSMEIHIPDNREKENIQKLNNELRNLREKLSGISKVQVGTKEIPNPHFLMLKTLHRKPPKGLPEKIKVPVYKTVINPVPLERRKEVLTEISHLEGKIEALRKNGQFTNVVKRDISWGTGDTGAEVTLYQEAPGGEVKYDKTNKFKIWVKEQVDSQIESWKRSFSNILNLPVNMFNNVKRAVVRSFEASSEFFQDLADDIKKSAEEVILKILKEHYPSEKALRELPRVQAVRPTIDEEKAYNQAAFLTANEAYASLQNAYYPVSKQQYCLRALLELGIRGLKISTWVDGNEIYLAYGRPKFQKWLRAKAALQGEKPIRLVDFLKDINGFLGKNPKEIVTLILEDYSKDKKKLEAAFAAADVTKFILKPANANESLGLTPKEWPTIKEMRGKKQQLVVLTDTKETSGGFFFYTWGAAVETEVFTKDLEQVAVERSESKEYGAQNTGKLKRSLLIVNHCTGHSDYLFRLDQLSLKDLLRELATWFNNVVKAGNDYTAFNRDELPKLLEIISKRGLGPTGDYAGMTPNFIVLDNASQGDPIRIVDQLNGGATEPSGKPEKLSPTGPTGPLKPLPGAIY
jgi:hypothetical protein